MRHGVGGGVQQRVPRVPVRRSIAIAALIAHTALLSACGFGAEASVNLRVLYHGVPVFVVAARCSATDSGDLDCSVGPPPEPAK